MDSGGPVFVPAALSWCMGKEQWQVTRRDKSLGCDWKNGSWSHNIHTLATKKPIASAIL